jgi:DNA-binding transcriptional regulator GbsR (MarR family)
MARSSARGTPASSAGARRVGETDEGHFADELGFFWENAGGTRMAGRVLGALLLADPPQMSSAQLAAFLGVSGGSISTATRELIRPGLAKRIRVPGERQDYFRATMGGAALSQFLHTRIQLSEQWVALLGRGEQLAARKNPAVRQQLEDVREFYEFIQQEQEAILRRWERRKRAR